MEFIKNDHQNVKDWGVDADKKVRPGYPMWKIPEEGTGAHWATPPEQPGFNDFFSNERPRPTRVFGNTVPPKGLSGLIRKFAFKYSEGSWAHWMGLIFADRVNMIEGLFEDVAHGVLPRPLIERGWRVDKRFKTLRYKKVVGFSVLAILSLIVISFRKRTNAT
jgi:hypothetical protein